jgi:hypothetical protein
MEKLFCKFQKILPSSFDVYIWVCMNLHYILKKFTMNLLSLSSVYC